MIEEGEAAPAFELPGVRDGRIEQVALSEYLGDEIVILAFYPGDFNPACSDGTTDLDELDLFTMQKDVSVLGLSGDSVYSHRAFAEEYDLHIPLLSDANGEVAAAYGVAVEDESVGHLTRRAIVVLGPRGEVEYSWVADDVDAMPDVDAVREAIQDVGRQDTALARYRVGHAHYIEGRRAFTSAMNAYEQTEWMLAKGDFDRAYEAFAGAEAEFNTAARFAEDERSRRYFEHAERKAESLWRAAEWLGDSANAYASGEGRTAESLRRDAEAPLETAREIHEPPSPDEFPPDEDPPELEEGTTATDADDEATAADGTATPGADGETAPGGGAGEAGEAAAEIDEAELEEIAAELEEQTEAAQGAADEVDDGAADEVDVDAAAEQSPDRGDDGTGDDEGIELDLTDPSDDEDEDDPGDQGVPDSL